VFFVHFWANDDAAKLAKRLRTTRCGKHGIVPGLIRRSAEISGGETMNLVSETYCCSIASHTSTSRRDVVRTATRRNES
jgi:hypothetical protein